VSGLYEACHAAGGMTAFEWERDPKRLGFILARYKFVAKMLAGKARVLEVGCADGFGSRIVRQHVGHLTAIDIEPESIEAAKRNNSEKWPIEFLTEDFMAGRLSQSWDASYALDVIEHMESPRELLRLMAYYSSVAIVGCPSLESQNYASELSKKGHINCQTQDDLRGEMLKHFRHVFLFGMNDETLHTGFGPMCQYRFAIGVN
jgi:SAM-dependent methyltransferase